MAKDKQQQEEDEVMDDDSKTSGYSIGKLDVIAGDIEDDYVEMEDEDEEDLESAETQSLEGETANSNDDWALKGAQEETDTDGWDSNYA